MRLWYVFVPLIAMGSLNAGYSAWRNGPPGKMTEVRRECFAKAEGMGLERSSSIELCNCLIGKARWYKWTSFGAEYTREVHHRLGLQCIAQMKTLSTDAGPSGFGTFESSPPRSNRPLTGPGSGWGEAPDDHEEDPDPADRTYGRSIAVEGEPGDGTE